MKIKVRTIPRSSKNEIKEISDGTLKIKVTAAPVGGKANEAVIKLLTEKFVVPKSRIKILSGLTGKNKIIEIE